MRQAAGGRRKQAGVHNQKQEPHTKVWEKGKVEDPGARKGRKVAQHFVLPMICGSGGSKSRLKVAGGEPAGQMNDQKLHAIVARSKMYKAHQHRTTFGSCGVEVHAVVARSTCRSQNAQSTSVPDPFWKLRC